MMPKEECEELLNALLPFAVNQLKKYGEFYPFGAVMQNNNEDRKSTRLNSSHAR